jgi:hypothetical protein
VGGVRTPGGSHRGALAVGTLRRLNLDIAFVEVSAVVAGGVLAADPLAADTDRALLAAARRRVLLALPGRPAIRIPGTSGDLIIRVRSGWPGPDPHRPRLAGA